MLRSHPMLRTAAVVAVLLATPGFSALLAQEFKTGGIIKKVDADKDMIQVLISGKDHSLKVPKQAKILDKNGKDLADGLKSKELESAVLVILTVEKGLVIKAIQLRGKALEPKASVGFKPLNEMTASDKYKGEDGGLYGGGKNEPPAEHQAAAQKETAKIVPLDKDGKPAKDGRIVLISMSMSNATQVFSVFKPIADADPQKSPLLTVVDCAQGSQTMAGWARPKGEAWQTANDRLTKAGVSPQQVQIVWIKLANGGPLGELDRHGKKLHSDTVSVLHNAKARFPNLRIAYLGSRIYGGWAFTQLNPEPYAYEGAFVVRWLIQDQIKGNADLNFDATRGTVKAPLLLWGPYLWADGTTPRKSDGLIWAHADMGGDGTHPSNSGRKKAAELLLNFFKTDSNAKKWFVQQ